MRKVSFADNLPQLVGHLFFFLRLSASVFYGLSVVLKFKSDFAVCLLLGCIVSPTDPIAATGILNKMGLSKDISSVIEGESLFNDGMGVALFVFVKSMITGKNGGNFFTVIVQGLTVKKFYEYIESKRSL